MTQERTFDWQPRHDERSRAYPIRSVIGEAVPRRYVLNRVGPVLDQGVEGACVGHGWTNEATAHPWPVDFTAADLGYDDRGQPWPKDPQAFAFAFYAWCQRHDPWAGEGYSGTSVLTGAEGMKALGFIPEFRWAFGVDDVIDTLIAHGPVVLGIEWRDGMYEAPGGELRGTGAAVGGHCILAVGYDPEHRWRDGTVTPGVALFNSWGHGWGVAGTAWMRADELGDLLAANGEACVPVTRAYGPVRATTERPSLWQRIRAWLARTLG